MRALHIQFRRFFCVLFQHHHHHQQICECAHLFRSEFQSFFALYFSHNTHTADNGKNRRQKSDMKQKKNRTAAKKSHIFLMIARDNANLVVKHCPFVGADL